MSGIVMMIIAIVVLGGAYLLYGRYLQNKWGIDPKAKTPAYEMEDGVDYVPADTLSLIHIWKCSNHRIPLWNGRTGDCNSGTHRVPFPGYHYHGIYYSIL